MSQHTNFSLNVYEAEATAFAAIENEIDKLGIFDSGDVEFGYLGSGKWYDYDENMLLLSARFPDVLFELTGEGDGREDYWRNYYKGGRAMRNTIEVKVISHDFDPEKLEGDPVQDIGQKYSCEN